MTRPCSSSLAAFESNVAHAGKQMASAADVRNKLTQSDRGLRMATTVIMKAPVRNAEHMVSVMVLKRAARKPVSQRLAIAMGTPTHATNSEICDTPK